MSLRASSRSMRSAPLTSSVSGASPTLTAAALMRCTAAVVMTSTAATSAMSRTASLFSWLMSPILPPGRGGPGREGPGRDSGQARRAGPAPSRCRTDWRGRRQRAVLRLRGLRRRRSGVALGDELAQRAAQLAVDVRPVLQEAHLDVLDGQCPVLAHEGLVEATLLLGGEDLAVQGSRLDEVVVVGAQGLGGSDELAVRLPADLSGSGLLGGVRAEGVRAVHRGARRVEVVSHLTLVLVVAHLGSVGHVHRQLVVVGADAVALSV